MLEAWPLYFYLRHSGHIYPTLWRKENYLDLILKSSAVHKGKIILLFAKNNFQYTRGVYLYASWIYFPSPLSKGLISFPISNLIYIASNSRQFSNNIKIKIKINTSFVSPGFRPLRANKIGFNLIIFSFYSHGKLSSYFQKASSGSTGWMWTNGTDANTGQQTSGGQYVK